MSKNLTDLFCRTATSAGKPQREYFDAKCPGLALRVGKEGRKTWTFAFTAPDGKRARMTLGTYPATSLDDARIAGVKTRGLVEAGHDPRVVPTKEAAEPVVTVADLVDQRVALELRYSSIVYIRTCLAVEARYDRHVIPAPYKEPDLEIETTIGAIRVRDFNAKHLDAIIRPMLDRGIAVESRHVFQDVKALFTFAVRHGVDGIKYSPLAEAKFPKLASDGEDDEGRVLTLEEIRIVWLNLPSAMGQSHHVPTIARLMLALGQRVSEVAGMRKSELNLLANRPDWTIPKERTKNKKIHVVPLNGVALEIIRDLVADAEGDVLFPNLHGEPLRNWSIAQAINRAQQPYHGAPMGKFGIPYWTSHDLRRTVSDLPTHEKNHLPVADRYMDHVLNHRGTTKNSVRKRHYNPYDFFDEKADALEEWGAFLANLVGEQAEQREAA